MIRIARSPSRSAHGGEHLRVLLVGPGEQLGRVRDVGDQVGHRALRLGHRRRPGAGRRPPRRARCASARRPGGRRRSPPAWRPSPRRARRAARAPRARRARRRARRRASSTARRWSQRVAPAGQQRRRGRVGRRRRLGHERAAAAPARRVQVAALHERGQRLAQRGARDPELAAELALGRQPRAGLEQAELDRGAEPLERLLERRLRLDGREDRAGDARGRASFTAARSRARAPSR